MSDLEFVLVEKENNIAVVTINRPEQFNALNWQVVNEIAAALESLDRNENIRCIVLTGSGEKAFAAGADIKEMADKTPIEMMGVGFANWDRIRRIHKPVIAAVSGYALGGGCELAMTCDLIVATSTAKFAQPEINIGVIPGAGGSQRLTRTIGKYLAMEMVLTGRQFTAQEMQEHGLVNKVVSPGEHINEAKKLAGEIASKAPLAALLAKEAVNKALETPLEEGLAYEKRNFCMLFSTEDQKEGMQAFAEKRPAQFKGK